MALRLQIDPIACDAFGYCAELVPELVTLDEWGYPKVDGGPVPIELAEATRGDPIVPAPGDPAGEGGGADP